MLDQRNVKVHIVDEVCDRDGCVDGDSDGCVDGDSDGCADGDSDVCSDGDRGGCADSDSDGCADGDRDGCADGDSDGCADGDSDGCADGDSDCCGDCDSSYYFLFIFHSTLPLQHGQTPLHYATAQGKVDVVKRLRFHHADVYFRNKVGMR